MSSRDFRLTQSASSSANLLLTFQLEHKYLFMASESIILGLNIQGLELISATRCITFSLGFSVGEAEALRIL
jgi:hypothetical protein